MRKTTAVLAGLVLTVSMFLAGCNGGNPAAPSAVSDGIRADRVVHQGAQQMVNSAEVFGESSRGRLWALEGTANGSIFGEYVCSETNTFGCVLELSPSVTRTQWSATQPFRIFATETLPVGVYTANFTAVEGAGYDSAGTVTKFNANITVVPDDYTPPTTSPANGETIDCSNSAIVINAPLGLSHSVSYWGLHRVNPDGTNSYIKVALADTASATIVVPVDFDSYGSPMSFIQPGQYVMELGYGTSWASTGDYKSRRLRIDFTVTGDQGSSGYWCRTIGQRSVADITGLEFKELPANMEAHTEAAKAQLQKEAADRFFGIIPSL